jgi:hypothetical protein
MEEEIMHAIAILILKAALAAALIITAAKLFARWALRRWEVPLDEETLERIEKSFKERR